MKFFQHFFGIISFRSSAYREVALNGDLYRESLPFVLFVCLVNSVLVTWIKGPGWESATRFFAPLFLGWGLSSWVYTWLAKFQKIQIPVTRILRVRGFTSIFTLLNIITVVVEPGSFATILPYVFMAIGLVTDIICIREAGETSTGRAVATLVLPFLIISFLLTLLFVVIAFIRSFL